MATPVAQPGPANLSDNAGLDEWLKEALLNHYLPEHVMKQLCEMVKECLMEGKLGAVLFAAPYTNTRQSPTSNLSARR